MPRTSSRALMLAALLLTACQAPGTRPPPGAGQAAGQNPTMTPAAWAEAGYLVDRFEAARQQGGMTGVSADIQQCYARATRPVVQRLPLRECMVLDTFASRLDAETAKIMPGVGGMPYYQAQTVAARYGRYGPMAGFADPQVLGGYLAQGSNSMFTVVASRQQH